MTDKYPSDEQIRALWIEATNGNHGDTTQAFVRWFSHNLVDKHEADRASRTAPATATASEISDRTLSVMHSVRLSLGMANPGAEWVAANFETFLLGTLRAMERALRRTDDAQKPSDGWSGWACQYPGRLPRLYGARSIAEVNLDEENGDRLLMLVESTPALRPAAADVPAVEQFRALLLEERDATIDVSGEVARQEAQIDLADHLLVKFNELFPEAPNVRA